MINEGEGIPIELRFADDIPGIVFNFVIADEDDQQAKQDGEEFLLCDRYRSNPISYMLKNTNFYDLLVYSQFFPSKGQARKG